MALGCKVACNMGGKRRFTDAAFRIGNHDDWHGELLITNEPLLGAMVTARRNSPLLLSASL